jgi:hypothetical protein
MQFVFIAAPAILAERCKVMFVNPWPDFYWLAFLKAAPPGI